MAKNKTIGSKLNGALKSKIQACRTIPPFIASIKLNSPKIRLPNVTKSVVGRANEQGQTTNINKNFFGSVCFSLINDNICSPIES